MRKPNLPVVFVSPTEHLSFIQAAEETRETDVIKMLIVLFTIYKFVILKEKKIKKMDCSHPLILHINTQRHIQNAKSVVNPLLRIIIFVFLLLKMA